MQRLYIFFLVGGWSKADGVGTLLRALACRRPGERFWSSNVPAAYSAKSAESELSVVQSVRRPVTRLGSPWMGLPPGPLRVGVRSDLRVLTADRW